MPFLWDKLLRPLAFKMDAESAHERGIRALEAGLAAPFYSEETDPILECSRFGLTFRNPLGIAAGFDKNGVVVEPLARLGFGFVEVGTVTARPQPGNPKPRLFRLPDDNALINRLGFNNDGADVVAARLKLSKACVAGVNIGRNKDVANDDAVENFLEAFRAVRDVADYVTINVSSPNTPALRELQQREHLNELLGALAAENLESDRPKPLLVKIAPDLDDASIESVCDLATTHRLSGIIATNTSTSRDGLTSDVSSIGEGGLSGRPIRRRSTEVIRTIYRYSPRGLAIIGVGGIFTSEDAFEKVCAGACLVQAYTGFVYGGPGFPSRINAGLAAILRERGFSSVDEAVGSSVK